MSTSPTEARSAKIRPESAGEEQRLRMRFPWPVARHHQSREIPFLRLSIYYAVAIGVAGLLIAYVPIVQRALVSPLTFSTAVDGLLTGQESLTGEIATTQASALLQYMDRAALTLIVILGSLVLTLPVTWVYMFTRRLRYDPSLVHSMMLLPIVVAGILMVVKHSIAVAFGLVAIVAAVRFRNTLRDPKDAVYIFLALGIGLAAGVQALDVALVISLTFNAVVLILWKYNIGSIYRGRVAQTGVLSIGDSELWLGRSLEERKGIRRRLKKEAAKLKTDGVLLVHAPQPEQARRVVEEYLSEDVKDWELVDVLPREDGLSTLEYVVQLKRETTPAEVLGDLDERLSEEVPSAEYIPFRRKP